MLSAEEFWNKTCDYISKAGRDPRYLDLDYCFTTYVPMTRFLEFEKRKRLYRAFLVDYYQKQRGLDVTSAQLKSYEVVK